VWERTRVPRYLALARIQLAGYTLRSLLRDSEVPARIPMTLQIFFISFSLSCHALPAVRVVYPPDYQRMTIVLCSGVLTLTYQTSGGTLFDYSRQMGTCVSSYAPYVVPRENERDQNLDTYHK